MAWTRYHQFILSKDEEERLGTSGTFPLQAYHIELVEIGDNPPYLKDLFDQWEIKKVLSAVDVGTLGGLVLDQELVYNHIFKYWNREVVWDLIERGQQISIIMRDLDTKTEHKLYLKKSTDDYFVISTFWNRDFVYRRNLKEGDLIRMCGHHLSKSFCFSVLRSG